MVPEASLVEIDGMAEMADAGVEEFVAEESCSCQLGYLVDIDYCRNYAGFGPR